MNMGTTPRLLLQEIRAPHLESWGVDFGCYRHLWALSESEGKFLFNQSVIDFRGPDFLMREIKPFRVPIGFTCIHNVADTPDQ
jgi:hypothetical protein